MSPTFTTLKPSFSCTQADARVAVHDTCTITAFGARKPANQACRARFVRTAMDVESVVLPVPGVPHTRMFGALLPAEAVDAICPLMHS